MSRLASRLDWSSFGYFSDEENAALLARTSLALRADGRFLLEVLDRDHLLQNFESKSLREVDGVRAWTSSRHPMTWIEILHVPRPACFGSFSLVLHSRYFGRAGWLSTWCSAEVSSMESLEHVEDRMSSRIRWVATLSGGLGAGLMILLLWVVFYWVPTDRSQGVVQRIFYVHLPAALVAFLAFGIVAVSSALFLWKRDERFDTAALSAAEGGMVFTAIVLITGPLWGRVAWGAWWVWDPKLTLTLVLWFIYLGYFLVRASTQNSERGKRFAAVLGIIGCLDIPPIYFSVKWFRSLHPGPVVMRAGGPGLDHEMLTTLCLGIVATVLVFLSAFLFRYRFGRLRQEMVHRGAAASRPPARVPEPRAGRR